MKNLLIRLLLLVCAVCALQTHLMERSVASVLKPYTNEGTKFRNMELTPKGVQTLCEAAAQGKPFVRLLTDGMLGTDFRFDGSGTEAGAICRRCKPDAYRTLLQSYRAVWQDLEYFPVADEECFYEESWGERRSYGGERTHEGCDIYAKKNLPEYYPIVSMTAGVVEQVGWLPLGGCRIGIRSPHGGYFYYAHLSSYRKTFTAGERVAAGEVLGFMGNSGYGKEGTSGRFPVHLHLGIYLRTAHRRELSVNPYGVLRFLDERKQKIRSKKFTYF